MTQGTSQNQKDFDDKDRAHFEHDYPNWAGGRSHHVYKTRLPITPYRFDGKLLSMTEQELDEMYEPRL